MFANSILITITCDVYWYLISVNLYISTNFYDLGVATGLVSPNSKTKVAIKTLKNLLDNSQRISLLWEIKILSNLDLHLNLVNMMGSCTSQLYSNEKLWLLLEYCEHGKLFD